MKGIKAWKNYLLSILILSTVLIAGCGKWFPLSKPTVTRAMPANEATGVYINMKVAAIFSNEMDSSTINTGTFTLTQNGVAVLGTVAYTGLTAVFTPATYLLPNTIYTATVTNGVESKEGNSMLNSYVWTFTTGLTADIIPPTVTLVDPTNTETSVATNRKLIASFSEDMDPFSLTPSTFKLYRGTTAVLGAVEVVGQSAVFRPTANLAANTLYTATITTGVNDMAGNALAANYVWTFTTGAGPDTTRPTVILVNPGVDAIDVALNKSVNVTFSEHMDPLTITNLNFIVAGVEGVVTYDPLTDIATFNPDGDLLPSTTYTATVSTDVKDLADNSLAVVYQWNFTTGSELAPGAIAFGTASTFGIMATSAVTETGAGLTVINGDLSLDPGTSIGTLLPAQVIGEIHINDSVSEQARLDLLDAYNTAKGLAPGTTMTPGADQGALYPFAGPLVGGTGGMAPGTYTSGSTMLINTPLILNANGDANAVWVFQIGSSLTTFVDPGYPGSTTAGGNVLLANGAQAKNIFFVSTLDATVGVGTTFNGTIVSGRNTTCQTAATINGRILTGATLAGTMALDECTVNVPMP